MKKGFCAVLFWLKAFFSMSLAVFILAYYMMTALAMYEYKTQEIQNATQSVFDFGKMGSQCNLLQPSTSQIRAAGVLKTVSANNRLEPPAGVSYWGFSLDWEVDTPATLNNRLGMMKTPFVNAFLQLNSTGFDKKMLEWYAQQCRKQRAMLELSLMPFSNPGEISDQIYGEVAQFMRFINEKYGVPIFLRFGHEMNGPWMDAYGLKPIEYRSGFQRLATMVHSLTNMTAMLWAPNVGNGYPYGATTRDVSAANLALLDTNRNGLLDNADDPYLPYYPGDEFVDWVGLSLYLYTIDAKTLQTTPAPSNYLQQLIGQNQFYTRFSETKGKPMALGETGAPYFLNTTTRPTAAEEMSVKQSWWQLLMETAVQQNSLFPNLKFFNYFEEKKSESANTGTVEFYTIKDFRITTDSSILSEFLKDVKGHPNFRWADDLKYGCNGQVALK